MKYTVMWAKSAEDHLADLWLQAEDRESIRRASDEDRTVLVLAVWTFRTGR